MDGASMDYHQEELELTRKLFNLEDVLDFTLKHRIEILLGSDYMYACYIDYKEGDGCYSSCLTPLLSLITGIKQYKSIHD